MILSFVVSRFRGFVPVRVCETCSSQTSPPSPLSWAGGPSESPAKPDTILIHAHPAPELEADWWVVPIDDVPPSNTGIMPPTFQAVGSRQQLTFGHESESYAARNGQVLMSTTV